MCIVYTSKSYKWCKKRNNNNNVQFTIWTVPPSTIRYNTYQLIAIFALLFMLHETYMFMMNFKQKLWFCLALYCYWNNIMIIITTFGSAGVKPFQVETFPSILKVFPIHLLQLIFFVNIKISCKWATFDMNTLKYYSPNPRLNHYNLL